MPSLRFSQRGLNLSFLLDINVAQIFLSFIVLLFSLTVHETAHAWTADRLGDPTARLLGRVSLNPLVHADLVGTVLFPLLALAAALAMRVLPVSPVRLGEPNLSAPIASMLAAAVSTNVLLAVFNMIPIPPLDGGNVLGGLLPRPLASRFDALLRLYGFILLHALMLTRGFDNVVIPPFRLLLSWLQ